MDTIVLVIFIASIVCLILGMVCELLFIFEEKYK